MTDFLIFFFGLSLLYICTISRLEGYIQVLRWQGIFLTLLVLPHAGDISFKNLIFILLETIGLKTILIPWFLKKILRDNEITRETEPYLPNFYSLGVATLILLAGLVLAYWALNYTAGLNPLHFGVAIAAVITGHFIILSRKKLITHTMGFLLIQNGIFLLSLAKIHEMPMIVNTGVLLNIFLAVFLFGIFMNRIKSTLEELDVRDLTSLKD